MSESKAFDVFHAWTYASNMGIDWKELFHPTPGRGAFYFHGRSASVRELVRGRNMRVTVSHNSPKVGIMKSVDRSFNDMFEGAPGLPARLLVRQRSWQGSVLSFSLTAKWGLLSTPIEGTVTVTDQDVTVDADLGLLRGLVPEKLAREVIGNGVKGLLR
jgi:hypothetical protein